MFPHGRQSASAWPRAGLGAGRCRQGIRPRSVSSPARLGHRAAPGTHRTEVNDPSACPAPSFSTCSCGTPPRSSSSPAQGSAEAPHARCAARRGTGWRTRRAHRSAQPVRRNIQPLALFPPGCRPVWLLPGGHCLGYGTSGHSLRRASNRPVPATPSTPNLSKVVPSEPSLQWRHADVTPPDPSLI